VQLFRLNQAAIGGELKRVRLHLGLSLSEVAKRSGVVQSNLWKIEAGRSAASLGTIFAVATALGLPISYLIADTMEIDREAVRRVARAEIEKMLPELESTLHAVAADWAAGCCTLVAYALLTGQPGFLGTVEYPTSEHRKVIADAVARLALWNNIVERVRLLSEIQTSPASALLSIGLWTKEGLAAHGKWLMESKSSGPPAWNPITPGRITGLLLGMQRNPFLMGELSALAVSMGLQDYQDPNNGLTEDDRVTVAADSMYSRLHNIHVLDKHFPVPLEMPAFLRRLNAAAKVRGKKAELARFLETSQVSVSQWLSGQREPSGGTTLRMLKWVALEEEKQNDPSGVRAPNGPGTRSRKSSNEKPKPSPNQK
jgi:transcriptional regulator with XRE-family HTH domain